MIRNAVENEEEKMEKLKEKRLKVVEKAKNAAEVLRSMLEHYDSELLTSIEMDTVKVNYTY